MTKRTRSKSTSDMTHTSTGNPDKTMTNVTTIGTTNTDTKTMTTMITIQNEADDEYDTEYDIYEGYDCVGHDTDGE